MSGSSRGSTAAASGGRLRYKGPTNEKGGAWEREVSGSAPRNRRFRYSSARPVADEKDGRSTVTRPCATAACFPRSDDRDPSRTGTVPCTAIRCRSGGFAPRGRPAVRFGRWRCWRVCWPAARRGRAARPCSEPRRTNCSTPPTPSARRRRCPPRCRASWTNGHSRPTSWNRATCCSCSRPTWTRRFVCPAISRSCPTGPSSWASTANCRWRARRSMKSNRPLRRWSMPRPRTRGSSPCAW